MADIGMGRERSHLVYIAQEGEISTWGTGSRKLCKYYHIITTPTPPGASLRGPSRRPRPPLPQLAPWHAMPGCANTSRFLVDHDARCRNPCQVRRSPCDGYRTSSISRHVDDGGDWRLTVVANVAAFLCASRSLHTSYSVACNLRLANR